MTGPFNLPAKLDLSQAMQLAGDLRKIDGDVHIDASRVTHLGALCLQALIAAARRARETGHSFELTGVSDKVLNQLKAMGTTPENIMEGAL